MCVCQGSCPQNYIGLKRLASTIVHWQHFKVPPAGWLCWPDRNQLASSVLICRVLAIQEADMPNNNQTRDSGDRGGRREDGRDQRGGPGARGGQGGGQKIDA
jgi:hypothetical protein